MPAKPIFSRAPLLPGRFAPLPLGAIRISGWLREQLLVVSEGGLTAAYLLGDAEGIRAAQAGMQALLAAQRDDGCLVPVAPYDWPRHGAALQALARYFTATADKQVTVAMLSACRFIWENLADHPLDLTGAALAGEVLQPVLWLYNVTGKGFLLKLADRLREGGVDWTAFCHTMPYKTGIDRLLPWDKLRAEAEAEGWDARRYHAGLCQRADTRHIAMGLKTPAMLAQFTGGIKHESAFDVGFAKLMKHHGAAHGCFQGDDLLAGGSPTRGARTDTVRALLTTLTALLVTQGHAAHGDLLERLAYNALPAACTADGRAWQHVQQANQVEISSAPRAWYSAGEDANLFLSREAEDYRFGEGHDGLAKDKSKKAAGTAGTAAWAEFAATQWLAARDGGLAAIGYAPCQVRYPIGGAAVRLDVESAYPFDGAVRLHVHTDRPVAFPLHLRIPSWAQGATMTLADEAIDAQPGAFATMDRTWRDGDLVTLTLPMPVQMEEGYHNSGAVVRGPLVFALAPEVAAEGEARHAASDWAYALLPGAGFSVACDPQAAAPFGQGTPVTIDAIGVPLPEWRLQAGSAAPPPVSPRAGRALAKRLRLVPYGGTVLRISQFPIAQSDT